MNWKEQEINKRKDDFNNEKDEHRLLLEKKECLHLFWKKLCQYNDSLPSEIRLRLCSDHSDPKNPQFAGRGSLTFDTTTFSLCPRIKYYKICSKGVDTIINLVFDPARNCIIAVEGEGTAIESYKGNIYEVDTTDGIEALVRSACTEEPVLGHLRILRPKINTEKSGCFIATVVYGNINAPEVVCLRQYRDVVLNNAKSGRFLIRLYYSISPYLAEFLDHSNLMKTMLKKHLLDPFVCFIERHYINQNKADASHNSKSVLPDKSTKGQK